MQIGWRIQSAIKMTHQSTKGCGRFSTRGISNRWGIKGKEEEEKKEKQIRISETSVVLSLLPLLSSLWTFVSGSISK
jgi:hypothetical protein